MFKILQKAQKSCQGQNIISLYALNGLKEQQATFIFTNTIDNFKTDLA